MNLLIIFSYNGSNFKGYQKQPKERTVQGEIESALSKLYDTDIRIYGSGRTDAGVHAINQYANFYVKEQKYVLHDLKYKLNKMLPKDIFIKTIRIVNDDFNARFAAKKKIYEYYLSPNNDKSIYFNSLLTLTNEKIDFTRLKHISKIFIGTHCYKNFTSKKEDKDNFVRTIYKIKIIKLNKSIIKLVFEGNGFMMYQIRMIVANMVFFSSSRVSSNEIISRLNSDERSITPYCFPPEGLYLKDVKY